ncbi:MFS transporter [Tabrizicola sp.]|uniref:MFS transporter n=1 Tax=Tabrizicola sp. TaxID=2005166 RepID=UPI00286B2A67|nr:MFS transporter [Tabrizicola sp.]
MTILARFIAASGLANLADGVAVVAWAWVASLLTRDALLIALVPVALRLPWFLLALPAGVVTDRVDRRRLILWMDALRGLAFAVAALALWLAMPLSPAPATGLSAPGLFALICGAALIVGGAEVFRDNAAQTMLPALVPHTALERANGRLWSVELVANSLIGPAFGAFLIAFALPLPFALNAAAYGAAVLLVLGISGSFRPVQTAPRNWRAELRQGLAFLRTAPLLRSLAWTTGAWNLLHQMVLIALVLHAQENLGLGAQVYGLVLAGGAIGGILGSLMGERIVRALGPARTTQWMLATSAPAFALMALAPGALTLALVFAVFEFSGLTWNIVSVSTRQRMIPDALLGRVNSLYRLLAWGMMPVGLILSGLIVRLTEGPLPRDVALTLPFWAAALGAVALTAAAWRALGRGFADG